MELLKHLSQRQYIDGEWVESANKNTRDIINPYNQEVIFTVSEGTKEDAERAILAARRAFESGEWSQETAETRGKSTCHRGQNQRTSRSVSTIRNIRYWKNVRRIICRYG